VSNLTTFILILVILQILMFYLFFRNLALCSFSYYVVRNKVTEKMRKRFQENLSWPVRVLFAKKEYYAAKIIMADDYDKYSGNLNDFFQSITISYVRKRQIRATVIPIFVIVFQILLPFAGGGSFQVSLYFYVSLAHYTIFVLIFIICFRFGHRLESFAEPERI
jgi:hypothetical protein